MSHCSTSSSNTCTTSCTCPRCTGTSAYTCTTTACSPTCTKTTCTKTTCTKTTCKPSSSSCSTSSTTSCMAIVQPGNPTACGSSTVPCSSTCSTTDTCTDTTCTTTRCSSSSSSSCSSSSSISSSSSCSSSSSSSSSDCSSTDGSTCESCSSESSDVSVLGRKKFCITFGKKCGHRLEEDIPGNTAIYVNGKLAPILKLRRGYEYYFSVKQDKHSDFNDTFLLTESPVGRYMGLSPVPLTGSFDPISRGTGRYLVTSKTPKIFYYQSSTSSFIGGFIKVSKK